MKKGKKGERGMKERGREEERGEGNEGERERGREEETKRMSRTTLMKSRSTQKSTVSCST